MLPLAGATGPPPGLAVRRTRPIIIPSPISDTRILAAPIFAPDRQPAAPGAEAAKSDTLFAGYAALGVATGRGVATAVVSLPGGQTRVVHNGDDLGGWRLVGIDRNRLTLARKGDRRTLVVGAPAAVAPQGADAATPAATAGL